MVFHGVTQLGSQAGFRFTKVNAINLCDKEFFFFFFLAKPAFSCNFAYLFGGLERSIMIACLHLSLVMLFTTVNVKGTSISI